MDTALGANIRTMINELDFDEDDNAPSLVDVPGDQDEGIIGSFVDDLVEVIDSYLWTLNAIVPHKARIDGDDVDDFVSVLSKVEKKELFNEIYATYQAWFGN